MYETLDLLLTRATCKNGTEIDAVEHYRYLKWAEGERAKIKRAMRRRFRRQTRQAIRMAF
jgi:hypothetical protein